MSFIRCYLKLKFCLMNLDIVSFKAILKTLKDCLQILGNNLKSGVGENEDIYSDLVTCGLHCQLIIDNIV